jgi:transforming growth factor-beta-induced protein
MKTKFAFVFVILAMLLAACGPQATPTLAPEPTPMPEPTAMPTEEPEMPKTIVDIAVEDGRFTSLVAAVEAAGLAETLSGEGPFTVFAPTDEAFTALGDTTTDLLKPENKAQLSDILLYHVVPGKVMAADVAGLDGQSAETALAGKSVAIKVDGDKVILNENVNVIITDIEASNGVIHVIDAVLLPPSGETMGEGAMTEKMDIVDTAVADSRFTTLVAAVQAAGLVDTLKSEGPFTVFAPTDEAFAALPTGTLENLLKPENKQQLTDILLYHVVPGSVMAADVVGLDGQSAETALSDQSISIKVDGDKVLLNDSIQVIITDIETSNGVIHVIDAVLLPAG